VELNFRFVLVGHGPRGASRCITANYDSVYIICTNAVSAAEIR
jgi:hypothetical protein